MSEESKKILPQIAITAYESNEEDIEVTNLLNGVNEENNVKIHEPRSVSPKPIRHKSRIILKSPITTHLQKSLSPGLSDLNSFTDVEVMSDSDDDKYYVRTPNLTPGPIDYFILTDVEDLSEDEGYEKTNKIIDELTDTEHFIDDKGIINEEYTEQPLESMPYFPQPHREILFHSKDGTVSALSPTEESNPIWLKSPNEEVKGFESEEEIITVEEHEDTESYIKNNNNTYYHDIDVGLVESVETVKEDRCKHKYRNRVLTSKKNITPEAECGKKRYRNKNRCNSEIEEIFEKRSEENKKKSLSKFISDSTLSNVTIPKQNQNIKTNKINNQENNNTFVIHDNRNGFSISIDFQSKNSVLLSIGRDYGNLSIRWLNDGIMTGDEANQTQQQNAKSINNSDYFSNELFSHKSSYYFDNILINTAISQSREELAKLVKAVEILENKVEKQEHLTNNFGIEKTDSGSSSDEVGSLNNVQRRIYQLLNDVQNQENQVRHSLSDIMQKLNHGGFPKTKNVQEVQGPSFRGNFNTASLPYRWWNRSMPCLPLSERHTFLSGSQDSLAESFQICYFTPKKKKKSVSRMSKNQNSGYCIWLPHNKTGSSEEIREPPKYDTKQELQVAASKPELKCEISMDDDTEIDLREHDWRFQHQINTETDDITKPSTSGWTGKSKPKENVSEL